MKRIAIAAICLALLSGCASYYTTPSGGVSLAAISEKDEAIADAFKREPAMTFPARIAIARVATSGYQSMTNSGYGRGAYSVITTRDIEREDALDRIVRLPQVADVAALARIIVPTSLTSTKELREAAAQLRTDALLVYTLDTSFRTESTQIGPLQTIALGMFDTENAIVTSTASFAIIDVRTGFMYGVGEATATGEKRSNIWGSGDAADKARQAAETKAFDQAMGEVGKLWASIVKDHAKSS